MTGLGERFSSAITRSSSALGFHSNGGNKMLSSSDPAYKDSYQTAMRLGGLVGGLGNDGNTCFMNSVLQSLASSSELVEFLDSFTSKWTKEIDVLPVNGKPSPSFSIALDELLSNLNKNHGKRAPTYKTRNLLKVMKDGPNKHLFLGYNQEDAQEFYQSVMKQVELEYVKLNKGEDSEDSEKEKNLKSQDKFLPFEEGMLSGLDKLGKTGNIYVPASQIDPSYPDADSKVFPLKLITPVDGLQCDRIGCTRCGEIGGIRYSVVSGLDLNLPPGNKSSFQLSELLDEWIQQEIIDGVECNRCGLVESLNTLKETIARYKETNVDERLMELTTRRIEEIETELAKPIINDDTYQKLHTKNKIQKSQKTKQCFFARPPPLLCIHINRSVFDPRTYMVRKNNAKIIFPMKLNLTDYVAEPSDINMDARLPFRVQDEVSKVDEERNESDQDVDDNNNTNQESEEMAEPAPPVNPYIQTIKSKVVNNGLTYSLKSAIAHFGTHNYGHYIAYRKYRKVWWRISDEIVRLSSEAEVLGSQGTFMLFYELSDLVDEKDNFDLNDISVVIPEAQEQTQQVSPESEDGSGDDADSNYYDEKMSVENGKLDNIGSSDSDDDDGEKPADIEEDMRQRELISIQANL
ncbi:hypothetical protein CANARDRAFT_174916 [[Candida] arabinofermentans NRRL YB-2248]|uniref:ubiquitinyl hydrolase 1 n=1 Tax=[Candida] arabinofermentans NRRL YB-2248 TaxID=983967 RepID=A0A1E4T583_9ASCO|nr:hypothetical protein CANARDRAFT_174916 [[Candida] arabinofermentans NRRL YB-2248]